MSIAKVSRALTSEKNARRAENSNAAKESRMSIAKVSRALTSTIDTIPSIVTTALITANRAENALNSIAATVNPDIIRRAGALSAATGALGWIGITG